MEWHRQAVEKAMRVLLIEDNVRLAGFVALGLDKAGFAVDVMHTAADAQAALGATRYDVVVLDIGLPDVSGLSILTGLRERGDSIPVLILSARDGIDDRVGALNRGADDYLLKPFAMEELVARLRALLRRPGDSLDSVLVRGNVAFDSSTREVRVGGEPVSLSRRERDALELLLRRFGKVVTKDAIEAAIYAFDDELSSNAIEVLIHRLRKRMMQAGATVHVHTLRGVGYLLSDRVP
jgi:DNA-binding response OmpR family regulator